jgi:hypothetical protein
VLVFLLVLPFTIALSPWTLHAAAIPEGKVAVQEAYGKLPLVFEANGGQTAPQVTFLSRGLGHTLFLTPTEAVLVLSKREAPSKGTFESSSKATQTVLRMTFLGANAKPRVTGQEELPGKANYFIGNDPAKWRTNVPTYAKVQNHDLYPGIDLIYYGNQRQLEYDFVVAPGADPQQIKLAFQGAEDVKIDGQGDLILQVNGGEVRLFKPNVYQNINGKKQIIAGRYILQPSQNDERLTNNVGPGIQIGFQVAAYDASRPLIIDPMLFYSSYLGGNGDDEAFGIAVDIAGNAYVTGLTTSTNFPTTLGAFQTAFGGGPYDVFVTKLNPTGSGLFYSTYLGGGGDDRARGIAVDAADNAYVTGFTFSTNFPTTAGAFQTAFPGGSAVFITKLNPTGSGLVYSTYLGGGGDDKAFGIAVDASGNAYVTGRTTGLPTTLGSFDPIDTCSGSAPFVTKLNTTGSGLVYSTFLCGNASTGQAVGIAVDVSGNAYVTGAASQTFPTTTGAFQTTLNGNNAFVAKLNPTGSGLVYSTFLGGSGTDNTHGITVDASGNAFVTGATNSTNFPITPGAFQTTLNGGSDAFVTKLNPTGTALVYSTYIGGSQGEDGDSIAVDPSGNAYVTGLTTSVDFPTTGGAFQMTYGGGGSDAFVTKLNPIGSGLVYSSFLGGVGSDAGRGIAVDAFPNPYAYVTGLTDSTNFPTTPGAFQTIYGGGPDDAFVTKVINIVLPLNSVGKVTGGGTINVTGGIGNFGFIVQSQSTTGPVTGDLQFQNHASGDKVKSVTFTSLTISGNTATFSGTCTDNGTPCTFMVNVTDNGEPGTNDSFTISISGGPSQGGTLRSGNIQIHR